jgi:hypothetical protein
VSESTRVQGMGIPGRLCVGWGGSTSAARLGTAAQSGSARAGSSPCRTDLEY